MESEIPESCSCCGASIPPKEGERYCTYCICFVPPIIIVRRIENDIREPDKRTISRDIR
jgi:hypothetical protein